MQVWAEDEARLGLKPLIRRVWAPVGRRPRARAKRGYEWSYLYGFVRPTTGEVWWLILPTVNKELFSMALGEFAKGRWEPASTNASFWSSIGQDGTPSGRSNYPKGYTFSSYPPALLSYNRRRGCGL